MLDSLTIATMGVLSGDGILIAMEGFGELAVETPSSPTQRPRSGIGLDFSMPLYETHRPKTRKQLSANDRKILSLAYNYMQGNLE